ncbi:MAG: hypothetical protein ACTH2X_00835 [Brachybacterium tyrofermentans]
MSKRVNLREALAQNDVPQAQTATPKAAPTPAPVEEEIARKETPLYVSQLDELARLRRRLNAERKAAEQAVPVDQRSPWIKDYQITRAAITFLLENASEIEGWTEEDVLESLRKLKS